MRISDWSSDVCSSDLTCPGRTGRRPVGPGEIGRMDFERFFAKEMAGLKAEGRYRIFADLERRAGDFPHAMRHGPGGAEAVTVWCPHDYLGIGQHPAVLAPIPAAIDRCGAGAAGPPHLSGTNHPPTARPPAR